MKCDAAIYSEMFMIFAYSALFLSKFSGMNTVFRDLGQFRGDRGRSDPLQPCATYPKKKKNLAERFKAPSRQIYIFS